MAFTVITESAATRIAVNTDDEAFIEFTDTAPTYDVRTDTTQEWPVGTVISGTCSTGTLTIDPNTSVNINSSTNSISVPQDYQFTLVNPGGNDEWYCSIYPKTFVGGATESGAGLIEIATTAEIDAGTAAFRAMSPDQFAASIHGTKSFSIAVFASDADCSTGNGTIGFCVPLEMDTMDIVDCVASVHTAGTTGTMDVQIRRRRGATDADVLSTKLTIDSTETSSTTAATAHTINTSNDDLNEGDLIYIDVDAVQTTAAKGLTVTITARLP